MVQRFFFHAGGRPRRRGTGGNRSRALRLRPGRRHARRGARRARRRAGPSDPVAQPLALAGSRISSPATRRRPISASPAGLDVGTHAIAHGIARSMPGDATPGEPRRVEVDCGFACHARRGQPSGRRDRVGQPSALRPRLQHRRRAGARTSRRGAPAHQAQPSRRAAGVVRLRGGVIHARKRKPHSAAGRPHETRELATWGRRPSASCACCPSRAGVRDHPANGLVERPKNSPPVALLGGGRFARLRDDQISAGGHFPRRLFLAAMVPTFPPPSRRRTPTDEFCVTRSTPASHAMHHPGTSSRRIIGATRRGTTPKVRNSRGRRPIQAFSIRKPARGKWTTTSPTSALSRRTAISPTSARASAPSTGSKP